MFVGDRHADQRLPAEERGDDDAAHERPAHVGAQRLPLVERIPQRDRDAEQSARRTPVDANASQLGTNPSGITRIALPSAKNSVATTATPITRRGRLWRRTATTIAPSVETEMTPNITQCPRRSGPFTPPASVAPARASAATTATATSSPARLRQVSPGRESSSSTANQATPGTTTRYTSMRLSSVGVRAAGDADRVERDDDGEAGQADRGEHQDGLARVAGQQVQPEPPAQAEHHCGHRSHGFSLARATT